MVLPIEIIFEKPDGNSFVLEVQFYARVMDVKKEIQKVYGFPPESYSLLYNGEIMEDDVTFSCYSVIDGSRVHLIFFVQEHFQPIPPPARQPLQPIPPMQMKEQEMLQMKMVEQEMLEMQMTEQEMLQMQMTEQEMLQMQMMEQEMLQMMNTNTNTKIQVTVRNEISKQQYVLEFDTGDNIKYLKGVIQDIETLRAGSFELMVGNRQIGGGLLEEEMWTLGNCGITNLTEITVTPKASATVEPNPSATVSKKPPAPKDPKTSAKAAPTKSCPAYYSEQMEVRMLGRHGTRHFTMVVDPRDKVSSLREKLEKMPKHPEFEIPPEYFFVHKQRVIDEEERSFIWNEVRPGDVIQVFAGDLIDLPDYLTRHPGAH